MLYECLKEIINEYYKEMKKLFEIMGNMAESLIIAWVIISMAVGSLTLIVSSMKYLMSSGYKVYNCLQDDEMVKYTDYNP